MRVLRDVECNSVRVVRRVRTRALGNGRCVTALSDSSSPFCHSPWPAFTVGLLCMSDLENGLWACDKPRTVYQKNTPATADFVMAMVKGDTANHWSIKAGDAQEGRLSTMFDGERPPGYHPMKKMGAIILGRPPVHYTTCPCLCPSWCHCVTWLRSNHAGIGGDNSEGAVGSFFEGAMTAGFSSQAADDAVQAEIVSAGYMHTYMAK